MGQMMSEQWTPNTEGVRMVFSFYPEMDGALKTSQRQAIAEFDRWLAKHDAEVVKAERERNINLLEGWKERLTSMGWRIPSSSDLEKAKAVEYCVQLIERGN
jgi:hypothetical protein